jgi:hypothetical protein
VIPALDRAAWDRLSPPAQYARVRWLAEALAASERIALVALERLAEEDARTASLRAELDEARVALEAAVARASQRGRELAEECLLCEADIRVCAGHDGDDLDCIHRQPPSPGGRLPRLHLPPAPAPSPEGSVVPGAAQEGGPFPQEWPE